MCAQISFLMQIPWLSLHVKVICYASIVSFLVFKDLLLVNLASATYPINTCLGSFPKYILPLSFPAPLSPVAPVMFTHSGSPPHPGHSSSSAVILPETSELPATLPHRPAPTASASADQTRASSRTHPPPSTCTPRPPSISPTRDSAAQPRLEPLDRPLPAARPQGRTAAVGEGLIPTWHLATITSRKVGPRPRAKAATTLLGGGPSGPAPGAGPGLDPGAAGPAQPSRGARRRAGTWRRSASGVPGAAVRRRRRARSPPARSSAAARRPRGLRPSAPATAAAPGPDG